MAITYTLSLYGTSPPLWRVHNWLGKWVREQGAELLEARHTGLNRASRGPTHPVHLRRTLSSGSSLSRQRGLLLLTCTVWGFCPPFPWRQSISGQHVYSLVQRAWHMHLVLKTLNRGCAEPKRGGDTSVVTRVPPGGLWRPPLSCCSTRPAEVALYGLEGWTPMLSIPGHGWAEHRRRGRAFGAVNNGKGRRSRRLDMGRVWGSPLTGKQINERGRSLGLTTLYRTHKKFRPVLHGVRPLLCIHSCKYLWQISPLNP